MIRKYHNHILQTSLWHHEEKLQIINSNNTSVKVKIARRQNKEIVLIEPVQYLHDISIGGAKCLVTMCKSRSF